jgi:uncharacterized protein (DUF1015 family)
MVEIIPFRGIRYNKEKINNLAEVMSPPYDIISEEMQHQLYDKHPYNIVRLILGKEYPDDTADNNKYTRAAKLLKEWLDEKILIKSEKPALYPYKIDYEIKGGKRTFNGFFVLLKLDPTYKQVKAHERTLSKPKADRLNLMRTTNANLEPIELLYIDEEDRIKREIDSYILNTEPIIDVVGYDGFTHKLWEIHEEELISFICDWMKDKILFIADGHHRYQTAIDFADEMREKTGNNDENAPFNYMMVVLANMFDKGLSILPTHRLIKMQNMDLDTMLEGAREHFDIEEKTFVNKDYQKQSEEITRALEPKEQEHKFALYAGGDKYYVLILKNEDILDKMMSRYSKTLRRLDVTILHKLMLESVMGINEDNIEDHVKYTRDNVEAIKAVAEGKFDYSFLMNATKIEELRDVANAGEHMPQKSTYFLPKLLSGLVMRKIE